MSVQGRVRWEVAPVPGSLKWSLSRNGREVATFWFKFRAVESARTTCRYELDNWLIPSELMVKDRRGRYTSEGSTYGDDPREIRG